MIYHLRLCKALSYCGVVEATKKNPDVFVEDKATADEAVATGYFKLVEEEADHEPPKDPAPPKDPEPGKTLDEMTVPELETYAAYKGVSLKGVRGKENILAKLTEELGETEGEVDYGSPTMTELQDN